MKTCVASTPFRRCGGLAGLGDFIHLPVKTYSQGMAARLLFAVLTSGSHDCLAMDEGWGCDNNFYDSPGPSGVIFDGSHPVAGFPTERLLERFCSRGLVFREGRTSSMVH